MKGLGKEEEREVEKETVLFKSVEWRNLCFVSRRACGITRGMLAQGTLVYVPEETWPKESPIEPVERLSSLADGRSFFGFGELSGLKEVFWLNGQGQTGARLEAVSDNGWTLRYRCSGKATESGGLLELLGSAGDGRLIIRAVRNGTEVATILMEREESYLEEHRRTKARRLIEGAANCQALREKIQIHCAISRPKSGRR